MKADKYFSIFLQKLSYALLSPMTKTARNPNTSVPFHAIGCGWWDSNPHASRHKNLNLTCLPIPSQPHLHAAKAHAYSITFLQSVCQEFCCRLILSSVSDMFCTSSNAFSMPFASSVCCSIAFPIFSTCSLERFVVSLISSAISATRF